MPGRRASGWSWRAEKARIAIPDSGDALAPSALTLDNKTILPAPTGGRGGLATTSAATLSSFCKRQSGASAGEPRQLPEADPRQGEPRAPQEIRGAERRLRQNSQKRLQTARR